MSPFPAVTFVVFQPVAELAQQAGGGRQVSDLQPGCELVDPAGLPLVDRGVLLAAELGKREQRGAPVIEVVPGFDQRLGEQPVDLVNM